MVKRLILILFFTIAIPLHTYAAQKNVENVGNNGNYLAAKTKVSINNPEIVKLMREGQVKRNQVESSRKRGMFIVTIILAISLLILKVYFWRTKSKEKI